MNNYRKALVIFIIMGGLLTYSHSVWAQSKVGTTAVSTLSWQNSARAKAMGGCSIALVDAQSQFSNPAAMGIFALDNVLAINVDSKTQGIPESDKDGIVYRTRGVMARLLPYGENFPGNNTRYAIAAGYTYSSIGFTIKSTSYEDWNGSEGTESHIKELYYEYSGSISLRYGAITAGAGYTEKKVRESFDGLTYRSHCYDLGALAIIRLASTRADFEQSVFNAAVSIGFVRANEGSMKFLNGTYDFPTVNIFGLSAWLDYKMGRNVDLTFVPAFQFETFEKDDHRDIKRVGLEAGFNEAIFGRVGYPIDEFDNEDYISFGFGLSFRGLYNNILYRSKKAASAGNILSHFDVRFDFARSKLVFFEKTNFYHFSISI